MTVLAGIDGCPGGWFGVISRAGRLDMHRSASLAGLCMEFADARTIYIDIPLGLPRDRPRAADRLARQALTGQASSVFPVPCRAAVYAPSWQAACEINAVHLGTRLSKQTWNICPKIREADGIANPALREAHPEICFRYLAGGPLGARKKTRAGQAARLAVLPAAHRDLYHEALRQWPRRELARDDVLDACALAAAAPELSATLPAPPEVDSCGRAMAIWVPPSVARL